MDFLSLSEFLHGSGKFLAKLTNIEKRYFLNFIVKFLEQNNFKQTAELFKNECAVLGYENFDSNTFKQYGSLHTELESPLSTNETIKTIQSTSSDLYHTDDPRVSYDFDKVYTENDLKSKRNISFNGLKSATYMNPTLDFSSSTTDTEDMKSSDKFILPKNIFLQNQTTNLHIKSRTITENYVLDETASERVTNNRSTEIIKGSNCSADESDVTTDHFSTDSILKPNELNYETSPMKHKNVIIENEIVTATIYDENLEETESDISYTNPFLSNCSCTQNETVSKMKPLEIVGSSQRDVNFQQVSEQNTGSYLKLMEEYLKLQENYSKLKEITKKLSQSIEDKIIYDSIQNLYQNWPEVTTPRDFSENHNLIITEFFDSERAILEAQNALKRRSSSNDSMNENERQRVETNPHDETTDILNNNSSMDSNNCKCLTAKNVIPIVNTTDRSSAAYPSWVTIMKSQNQFFNNPPSSLYETDPKIILSPNGKLSDTSNDLQSQPMSSQQAPTATISNPPRIKIFDSNQQKCLANKESSVTFDVDSIESSRTKKSIMKSSDSNSSSVLSNVYQMGAVRQIHDVLNSIDVPTKEVVIPKKIPTKTISKRIMKKQAKDCNISSDADLNKNNNNNNDMDLPNISRSFPLCFDENNYFPLDFSKIINDLKVGPTYLRIRLLQALRWRLTHASIDMRDVVIKQYVNNDIFGLMDSLTNVQKSSSVFLSSFYFPKAHRTPHAIQQNIARFVNAVASLRIGRDYLTNDLSILQNILLRIIMLPERCGFNFDSISEEMVLATLQKFSLRNAQRLCMITEGLVEHLVKSLTDKSKSYSMYRLEYTTALLMNLCLHKEAQNRCALILPTVIELIIQLLDSKYSPCLLYVNAIIYSLFMNQNIFNYARYAGIANLIKTRSKQCEGDVQQQLKFLYRYMNDPQFAKTKCVCEPRNECDDEIDLIEPEIEMFDNSTNSYRNEILVGEMLLRNRYNTSIATPPAPVNSDPMKSIISEIHLIHEKKDETTAIIMNEKMVTDKRTSTADLLSLKTISIQYDFRNEDAIHKSTEMHTKSTMQLSEMANTMLFNEQQKVRRKDMAQPLNEISLTSEDDETSEQKQKQTTHDYFLPLTFKPENCESMDFEVDDLKLHMNQEIQTDDEFISLNHQYTQTEDIQSNSNQQSICETLKCHQHSDNTHENCHCVCVCNTSHREENNIEQKQNGTDGKQDGDADDVCTKNDVSLTETNITETAKIKRVINKKHIKSKLSPLTDHNNVSYNEQTKQFYKKPTKYAIFERKIPPPFTSTKPDPPPSTSPSSFSRTGPTLDTNKNSFNIQTCQIYPDFSKRPYYIQSSVYNPPYALDYYNPKVKYYPPMNNNSSAKRKSDKDSFFPNNYYNNRENLTVKSTNSEKRLLNEFSKRGHDTTTTVFPKLHKEKIFRTDSESKLLSDELKPYTHFSKQQSTGNYSILDIMNPKLMVRNSCGLNRNNNSAIQSTSNGSRNKSGILPKNPFKSRPKLPRTPPTDDLM